MSGEHPAVKIGQAKRAGGGGGRIEEGHHRLSARRDGEGERAHHLVAAVLLELLVHTPECLLDLSLGLLQGLGLGLGEGQ